MGYMSRGYDRLPRWAQLILMTLGLAGMVYGVSHYGWTFLLKALFSPEL